MKKITHLAAMLIAFATSAIAQCDEALLPYHENFDTAELPYLPDCTYSVKQMFGGNDWETVGAPNANFSGNVASYDTNSIENQAMYCYYYMRPVQLTTGMAYKISYKYAHDDTATPIDRLAVKLNYGGLGEISISSHEEILGTNVVNYSSELFTVPTTDSYYLYFNIESVGNQGILYLDDIRIEEMGAMGTDHLELAELTYYPNPVKDMLTLSNTTQLESLEVYNPAGQSLLMQYPSEETATISFENLPSGIYFLQAKSKGAIKTIPIIRQ